MKHLKKAALAASILAIGVSFSLGWSEQGGVSLSLESAQARVGRPLTPVSVAGVARRHARRGAYGYGVAGAAAVGAAALGTAAVVAGAPYAYGAYPGYGYQEAGPYAGMGSYGYHQSWDDYAKQNGIVCRPGSMVKLDDGRMYPCQ
jgi:hypothetical protein